MNKKCKVLLAAIAVMLLSACNKNVDTTTTLPVPFISLSIDGAEHRYTQYTESNSSTIFSVQLPSIPFTAAESLSQGEPEWENPYSFYQIVELPGNEAVIKKYDNRARNEVWVICLLCDFESAEDILAFFGIESGADICSVKVWRLEYNEGNYYGEYRLYGTFDNIGNEVYQLLAAMQKDVLEAGGNIDGHVGNADPAFYKAWADGVLKLDVTLASGVTLPVFYSETSDYLGILDGIGDFSGHPDTSAAEALKEVLGIS